jgi:hypothetical protein
MYNAYVIINKNKIFSIGLPSKLIRKLCNTNSLSKNGVLRKTAFQVDEYGFPVKEITSVNDIPDAIKSFQKEINLKSNLSFDDLPLF